MGLRQYNPLSYQPLLQYGLPVLLHDVLKRPKEVFLETEIRQLSFLQELHGELPQWVHCKDGYILIGVTAHLHTGTQKDNNNGSFLSGHL